jgi:tetratricopeptide (TPR) repeat protein
MNVKLSLALSSLVVFFSGCTSLQVNSEFGSGRQAYLAGNNNVALSYFQSTAQKDSAYTYYGYAFRQGIWSYVGRTEYAIGSFPQARQSLERALSLNRNEELARLYLGLTLVRSGDRQQGLKEMEGGMRAIYDQTEYLTQNFRFSLGQFWDPGREIRTAIQDNLAMLSSREVDVQTVLANGEWLGKRVEQEIDWARRDQRDDIFRDGAARPD